MKRICFVDVVTGGKASVKFPDCFPAWFCGSLDCLNPLSFLLRVHFSTAVQLLSERIRWGVHRRGIRQSAYNSPPWLWINQHWGKTIKPMRYGYLFILITHRGALWIVWGKCITWRGLRTHIAPAISISLYVCNVWVQGRSSSPLKQPLDRYPIRLWPFPPSRILFCPSHPPAIIEEMKVNDGEYVEMVWIDGWLVWLSLQSSLRGRNICHTIPHYILMLYHKYQKSIYLGWSW